MIASAKRYLKKDQPLSTLQKIDKLHKVHKDFEGGEWVGSPWLVCPDMYCIPATTPVPEMLEAIEKHGEPCGIVGGAFLFKTTPRRFHVLTIHFMAKGECRKAVEASEKSTWKKYIQTTRQIQDLHKYGGDA
jgi:hypothetical protein